MKAAVVPAVSGTWQIKDVPQPLLGPSAAHRDPESAGSPMNAWTTITASRRGLFRIAHKHPWPFAALEQSLDNSRPNVSARASDKKSRP